MKCPSDGFWRTYLDEGCLPGAENEAASTHLSDCERCRTVVERISADKNQIEKLVFVRPPERIPAWTPDAAGKKESRTINLKTAIVSAVLVGLLAVSTFPPARTIAGEFLQLFRAEKFEAIRIDPQAMADFDPTQMGNFDFEPPDVSEADSIEDAFKKTGLKVTEPGNLPPNIKRNHLMASSGTTMSLKIDLPKFRRYLADKKIAGINLPDSLNDTTITAKVPPYVMMEYGLPGSNGQPTLVVAQSGLPEVEVPQGVSFDKVREELLKLPFFPPNVRAQLSAIADWKSTLPIPYPGDDVSSEKVIVANSHDELYFESKYGEKVLIWMADDNAHGVVAPAKSSLSRADLFAIANTME